MAKKASIKRKTANVEPEKKSTQNNQTYFQKNISVIKSAFKSPGKSIAMMSLMDILLYASAYAIFQIALLLLLSLDSGSGSVVGLLSKILSLTQQQAENLVSQLIWILVRLLSIIIGAYIALILAWSLFKGISWNIAANKRFDVAFFRKFFLLNLFWAAILLALFLIISLGFQQSSVPMSLLAVSFIFLYFTPIIYAINTEKRRFGSIASGLKMGILKIHYFVLPFALSLLLYYLSFNIPVLLRLQGNAATAAFLLLLSISAAVSRLYYVQMTKELQI
ncbi:hypothetical protein J4212_01380 [Candidatus Woesearchaeota archaeon]|nr:hypothetical protein [Candidatus Woesearchaeota archaeon]